jgi:hypothetical protein
LQGEFLLGTLGGIGKSLQQLQPFGEVVDRFLVRRSSDSLFSGMLEILHCFRGIATATVMVR